MILLNPGPVNVSPRVTAALARGDLCHREPEAYALLDRIRGSLCDAFAPAGGFTPVLVTGSGTAALEMAVSSVLSPAGRLVVVSNGVYGERIAAMATAHGLPHTVVASEWTARPDLAAVERAVAAPDVEAVALVHHETTTGLLNPVAEVGAIARRHGKLLARRFDQRPRRRCARPGRRRPGGRYGEQVHPGPAGHGVRAGAFGGAGAPGGASTADDVPGARHVREEPDAVHAGRAGGLCARRSARRAQRGGVDARIARYARAATQLRAGFARLGLACILPPELRSSSITALRFPEGRTYGALHDALKARGFVVYEGQGRLAREVFRVANMGHLEPADFDAFLGALGEVLARMTAIILAAGVGKRLHAVSGGRPKCLIEIGGTSLLRRLLESLAACGVAEAVIVTGFGADAVRAAVATPPAGIRVRTVFNARFKEGAILSLATAREMLDVRYS